MDIADTPAYKGILTHYLIKSERYLLCTCIISYYFDIDSSHYRYYDVNY